MDGEAYIYWATMGVRLASGDNRVSIEIGTRAGGVVDGEAYIYWATMGVRLASETTGCQ